MRRGDTEVKRECPGETGGQREKKNITRHRSALGMPWIKCLGGGGGKPRRGKALTVSQPVHLLVKVGIRNNYSSGFRNLDFRVSPLDTCFRFIFSTFFVPKLLC